MRSPFSFIATLFDNKAYDAGGDPKRIDWLRVSPFILVHIAAFAVFFDVVGWSWTAIAVCFASYFLRMFGITAFYHRLLSHRAFKCPRWVAAAGAFLGNASAQRGPLWWAAHHRHHHKYSDQEEDSHSPIMGTFIHSHVGWFLTRGNFATKEELVPDLADRWEMRFLDRFDWFAPVVWAVGCFAIGAIVSATGLDPRATGLQTFVWGFLVATVLTWHCTFLVNSLNHLWGSRPYKTTDSSRNNPLIAILTLGEGWHNNHHYYQASARQGFRWWQYDVSYYLLRAMKVVGMVTKLNPVPKHIVEKANKYKADEKATAHVTVEAEIDQTADLDAAATNEVSDETSLDKPALQESANDKPRPDSESPATARTVTSDSSISKH